MATKGQEICVFPYLPFSCNNLIILGFSESNIVACTSGDDTHVNILSIFVGQLLHQLRQHHLRHAQLDFLFLLVYIHAIKIVNLPLNM